MTDVLICGAGPTGLALAIELARRNVSLRIVERDLVPPTNPRAFVLKPSSLIAAEQMGFLEQLLEDGVVVEAMLYSFEGRIIATATSPSERWPWHLNLGEDRLIPILTTRLEQLGVVIERGIELDRFEQKPDGVQVELRNRAGREESLEVSWLVGCDGVHSAVREGTGIAFEGHDRSLHWHVLDAQIEGWPYKDSHGILFFESHVVGVYRTKEVFRIYSSSFENCEESWTRIRDFLQEHMPSVKLGPPLNDTAFRSKSRLGDTFRSGRILLAGDAAHTMSPAAGLGLNCGVQDALNLGWKLAATIKGHAPDTLLDTYDFERRPAAQAAMDASQRNDDLFSITDPAQRSRAFRNFAVRTHHYLKGGGSGYEAVMGDYEQSFIATGSAAEFGPGPGALLPSDTRLAKADGRPCYLTGQLATGTLSVVVFISDGGIEAENLVKEAIDLCAPRRQDLSLTVVARSIEGAAARRALEHQHTLLLVDQDMTVHNRLGIVDKCVMWVRPDGRIGFRQDDVSEVSALETALGTALPGLVGC
ncbi:MAG: FAD-dependent monooxygenase [Roseibium sp.]|uniref:FAD-dependent oxidoreductase n=1 Tax=Roseibium sp. TaxID=1936156 RepID=UPI0026022FF6|nr:FAD-dependent monooxygenase [Roseibium sp.]MCV0426300.1 FAD-dependent monooxygenase [Roseibium sp.]